VLRRGRPAPLCRRQSFPEAGLSFVFLEMSPPSRAHAPRGVSRDSGDAEETPRRRGLLSKGLERPSPAFGGDPIDEQASFHAEGSSTVTAVAGGESPMRFSSRSEGTWAQAREAPLDRDGSTQQGPWDVTNPKATRLRSGTTFSCRDREPRRVLLRGGDPRGTLLRQGASGSSSSRWRPAQDTAGFRSELLRRHRAPRKDLGTIRQAPRQGFP
jgi:hypothetical protein